MKFRDYITFDNLSFQGSNKNAFVILSSSNITIQNCIINYSGGNAIWGNHNFGRPSSAFVLKNSTINNTNNVAIKLASEFAGALISNNTIKNTGMIVGMGGSGDGTYEAVSTRANNVVIEYNKIDTVGYTAIRFLNNSSGSINQHKLIRTSICAGYNNFCSVAYRIGINFYTKLCG